jgi:hypothetical protein
MMQSFSFLKIVDFESFREFCKYRTQGNCDNPDNLDHTCHRANKKTMMKCPLWKAFRSYHKRPEDELQQIHRSCREKAATKGKSFKDAESW